MKRATRAHLQEVALRMYPDDGPLAAFYVTGAYDLSAHCAERGTPDLAVWAYTDIALAACGWYGEFEYFDRCIAEQCIAELEGLA